MERRNGAVQQGTGGLEQQVCHCVVLSMLCCSHGVHQAQMVGHWVWWVAIIMQGIRRESSKSLTLATNR